MSETRADAELAEWLGFPSPPHRIRYGRARTRLIAGNAVAGLLFLIGLGILVAYFGFGRAGRDLVMDTALAAGLGTPLPGARVAISACDFLPTRAASLLPLHWACTATVVAAGRRTAVLAIQTVSRTDLRPLGAGIILDETALYWPPTTLAARWWNVAALVLAGIGLIATALLVLIGLAGDRRLLRARRGQVRAVDLLTWKGRPRFAYLDAKGRRRFQRTRRNTAPLVLDGLRTRGAAIVSGQSAVLIAADLHPLELDEAGRAAILARVSQLHHQGLVRAGLPPQPGDPPTFMRRIERIENAVAAEPGKAELARLYDEAWRLSWDSDDEGVSTRTLAARNTVAKLLGPLAAFTALAACRRRYG